MARIRDWLDLGRTTIESLKISDATRFYETEWPETRKMLIADHREAIEGETKRFRRFVRTRSAILYGLARRLAPLRRVIFAVTFVWFFGLMQGARGPIIIASVARLVLGGGVGTIYGTLSLAMGW